MYICTQHKNRRIHTEWRFMNMASSDCKLIHPPAAGNYYTELTLYPILSACSWDLLISSSDILENSFFSCCAITSSSLTSSDGELFSTHTPLPPRAVPFEKWTPFRVFPGLLSLYMAFILCISSLLASSFLARGCCLAPCRVQKASSLSCVR